MILTKNELLFIDDKITLSLFDIAEDEEDYFNLINEESLKPRSGNSSIITSLELIYKISKACLECEENNINEIEIDLDVKDIILIREIAQSNAKINNENIGVALKLKIMKEIVNIFHEDFGDIDISSLPVSKKREKKKEEVKKILENFKE